jgi:hypothetical protein
MDKELDVNFLDPAPEVEEIIECLVGHDQLKIIIKKERLQCILGTKLE